jgi:hypothetical protein
MKQNKKIIKQYSQIDKYEKSVIAEIYRAGRTLHSKRICTRN